MKTLFFSNERLQIKICGLKTVEDAQAAIQAGADALGFNFYPSSKRFVSLEAALAIIATLPCEVARIAVVVNPTSAELRLLLESNAFDAVQFHGDESPEFCRNSGFPTWIKAIRIGTGEQIQAEILSFPTPYILLDTGTNKAYGGTGILIDIPAAARIVRAFPDKHFLLAGGLRPENVREAAMAVRPFALDVASGVEDGHGRKIPAKIRAFIESAQVS